MDFPDIIYRNNNYVENLHATDNNENKNIILYNTFTYLNNNYTKLSSNNDIINQISKYLIQLQIS